VRSAPGRGRATYKEALLHARTFRPRFPANDRHGWYNERTMCGTGRPSIWSRLQHGGNIHDRLGRRVTSIDGGGQMASVWLQQLRFKAGANKCFNCLSTGHRIAS
jgi:hypothetical protein